MNGSVWLMWSLLGEIQLFVEERHVCLFTKGN